MDTTLEDWSDFNVAMAGASAALAGLIIVAMSVNITSILQTKSIPARAAAAIGSLVLGVAASCLALIPQHNLHVLGIEIGVGALGAIALQAISVRDILREHYPSGGGGRVEKVVIGSIAPAAFAVGAAMLIAGNIDGYQVVAIGSVLAIIGGVLFSWIALVEILR